jgi:hypothetical protein
MSILRRLPVHFGLAYLPSGGANDLLKKKSLSGWKLQLHSGSFQARPHVLERHDFRGLVGRALAGLGVEGDQKMALGPVCGTNTKRFDGSGTIACALSTVVSWKCWNGLGRTTRVIFYANWRMVPMALIRQFTLAKHSTA